MSRLLGLNSWDGTSVQAAGVSWIRARARSLSMAVYDADAAASGGENRHTIFVIRYRIVSKTEQSGALPVPGNHSDAPLARGPA